MRRLALGPKAEGPRFGGRNWRRWVASLASGAAMGVAHAQAVDPSAALAAANQIVQLIDAGRAAQVWEGASPAARQFVSNDRFATDVAAARQARGAAASRQWVGVTRSEAAGSASLPAGVYMSVAFETRFATGAVTTELVSFRQDDDKTWRLTGYVLK